MLWIAWRSLREFPRGRLSLRRWELALIQPETREVLFSLGWVR